MYVLHKTTRIRKKERIRLHEVYMNNQNLNQEIITSKETKKKKLYKTLVTVTQSFEKILNL